MNLTVDVEVLTGTDTPSSDLIEQWIAATLQVSDQLSCSDDLSVEVSVRIVDCEEMQHLNKTWRGKDSATNVLSFPSGTALQFDFCHLGDIVVCAPVVEDEARDQSKTVQAHWAHMLVHGTLHLLGHDHIEDTEAELMESLEANILQQLNLPNPYMLQSSGRSPARQ
ncbi:MAG: putative rRNA maturation factor [Halieaceae bacterium]|jgi:probable rRNA maturation factor